MAPSLLPPLDLSHHFSRATKKREESSVKRFYKFFQIPNIRNLAGGLPNAALFPFDTLEAQIAKPDRWATTPNSPVDNLATKVALTSLSSAKSTQSPATHITVPRNDTEIDPSLKIDVSTALQYGAPGGYPPLLSFIRQFTRNQLHPNVPYLNGPEVILTCGATDGLCKVVEMMVEPWLAERDPLEERPGMLCEVFVYPNGPLTVKPKGMQIVPVEIDAEGMLVSGPGGLQDVLKNWDPRNGRRPQLMYTVTMGHNPTSGVLSLERRRHIYALCSKYDIIIIEDDPYWHLQFPSAAAAEAKSRGLSMPSVPATYKPRKSSGYDFLDSLVPSYMSLDTDGRVIRLDTFSKTMAPGCRLGWVTAQPAFIERLTRITETSTQQPSGFVQATVAEALIGPDPDGLSLFRSLPIHGRLTFEGWSVAGWVRWLAGIRGCIERRMLKISTILDENAYQLKQSTPVSDLEADWGVITKTKLISFDWPRGGMFIWLCVHFEEHPLWQVKGKTIPVLDGPTLSNAFMTFLTHKPYLILLAPGTMFSATPQIDSERSWRYFRLCFAAETANNIEPCARQFVNGLHKFWRIKSIREMERFVHELDTEDVGTECLSNLGYSMIGC